MKKQIFKIEEAEGKQLLKIVTWVDEMILVFDDSFLHITASRGYGGDIEYEFNNEINDFTNIFDKESAVESTILSSEEYDKLHDEELAQVVKDIKEMEKNERLEYLRLKAKYEP